MQDILVIGYSTRNIVCSGRRAGYNVYSIDAFCDLDLKDCASGYRQIDPEDAIDVKKMDPKKLSGLIEDFGINFDAIILGSGFETMDISGFPYPVLNNDPSVMKKVSDKGKFAKILDSIGLPHPRTSPATESGSLQYPIMLKPKNGGGGIFNRVAAKPDEVGSILEELSSTDQLIDAADVVAQEFISGIPASVSVISTHDKAVSIAVNEQLIGTPWLSSLPFAYCGNITPFKTPYAERMCDIAEELILELGLVGSNGVDFIVTENGPVVIEVNARFQGSLDCVEMATGISLFDAHVRSFDSHLPERMPSCNGFAGRAVLYSGNDLVVTNDLVDRLFEGKNADIPEVGFRINAGDPVTSILATGKSALEVKESIKESSYIIRKILESTM